MNSTRSAMGVWCVVFGLFAIEPLRGSEADLKLKSARETLADLAARAPSDLSDYARVVAFSRDVIAAVGSDVLRSCEEYLLAGRLANEGHGEFPSNQVAYECFLTSVAKRCRDAEDRLPEAWDKLLLSISRPARMGFMERIAGNRESELFESDPASETITKVWREPAVARDRAKGARDNEELVSIEAADQEARKDGWDGLTQEQVEEIRSDDRRRRRKVLAMLESGQILTVDDFARAALVMQHGEHFRHFQVAHELAVGALLLGDQGVGRWLVAATYDRMLYSLGLRQRFGTQEDLPVEQEGICDEQRVTFKAVPLHGDSGTRKAGDGKN